MNKIRLGFCFWDIPIAIVLCISIVTLFVQQVRHKKKLKAIRQNK